MVGLREQVDLIREVLTYSERFYGTTFVIKISNQIIDRPDFPQHAADLALLHKAGIRIAIIPGAGKKIDEIFSRYGIEKKYIGTIQVSNPETVELVKMAAFDMAHRVMTALSGHGITPLIGDWIKARSRGIHQGEDFGSSGIVDRVRIESVIRSLELGHLLIFPCIGHNDIGRPFNLSSNELAQNIAISLGAKKLFLLTADPVMKAPQWKMPSGVEILEDGRIFRMLPNVATELAAMNPDKPERINLDTAAAACRAGIERSHILDGCQSGILLKEVFSNLGAGTMVFADVYERIRRMEISDVSDMLEIMKPLVVQGMLIRRTRENIVKKQNDYWVYAMDGVVHGCAALHIHSELTAEIAGVAVDSRYAQLGIGRKLIAKLLEEAKKIGSQKVFALSSRSSDWFLSQGFHEASISSLPVKRQKEYDAVRKPKILVKELSG
ncbi:hypothetical protein S1OALGB6SA_143 [Olavius algarvensis spirochete endosymbiont]|uniref:amino-acid N-acetyltransferase n=1 Tax=Olavius algarvensis spirochete endosymbiont TaxID=260710 RepID=UPI000F17ABCE|nr:amino-acid N-acetyltransferase [Olavius algarvensis spirochete endosymbiont]CAD7836817.1 MAG: hypothetical protein [Olavius algarvensis spirochete endosymbiont]VDA99081.1 hypothetical protein S1OALGB6SA_143 [Olavius algarvensis spirochete endosymbiont]